ncbi:MAG: hypothetical protein AB7O98_06530 [Hyphomonadaceae bacterium]
MLRTLCLALAALALLAAPAHAQQSVAGDWSGVALQNQPEQTWTLELVLNADGAGTIAYPSLNCGGTVEPESRQGGVILLREHITYGRCVNKGVIGIYMFSGRLMWFWVGDEFEYPNMSASAVLYRQE